MELFLSGVVALAHRPMHRPLELGELEEPVASESRDRRCPTMASVLVPNLQPGPVGLEELEAEGALRGAGCPKS